MDNEEMKSSEDFCATMVDVNVYSHDPPITKLLFQTTDQNHSEVEDASTENPTDGVIEKDESES